MKVKQQRGRIATSFGWTLVSSFGIFCLSWLLPASPATSQSPPIPPLPTPSGVGAGHWELISDATGEVFVPDPHQIGKTSGVGMSKSMATSRSGDAAKGAQVFLKVPSSEIGRRIVGAKKAKSDTTAGLDIAPFLAIAALTPDLYDEHGNRAWKLRTDGEQAFFIPYDSSGIERTDHALTLHVPALVGSGSGGVRIRVTGGALSPYLHLEGDFRNPLLDIESEHLYGSY
ncbi:MAG: hypothetical protein HY692_02705 [Cyanobacteria bacterium NC_groundwater_1444_Ag_S-0.65um_54_12]|nr:hypothetical protein [Cyanobacteria bacterium NC_groundwater_1444_Ag_S-0.65um_54_12]